MQLQETESIADKIEMDNVNILEDNAKAIILLEVKFVEGVTQDFQIEEGVENVKTGMVDYLHATVCLCLEKVKFTDIAAGEELMSSLRHAGRTMGNYEKMAEMLRTVYYKTPEIGESYEKTVASSGAIMATQILNIEADKRSMFFNGYTGFHQMIIDLLSGQFGPDALGECRMIKVR